MHIPCNKVRNSTILSIPVPSHAGLLQVQIGSELREGKWGLPVPMSPWEHSLNSSVVYGQELGMRFFLAGLYSLVFFFVKWVLPKPRRSEGFPRNRRINVLHFLPEVLCAKHSVTALMNSPSTLFCCSGENNCLATTCSVLESFTGPDTRFLLRKHVHSYSKIHYINERFIRISSLVQRVYYNWLLMRTFWSRVPYGL